MLSYPSVVSTKVISDAWGMCSFNPKGWVESVWGQGFIDTLHRTLYETQKAPLTCTQPGSPHFQLVYATRLAFPSWLNHWYSPVPLVSWSPVQKYWCSLLICSFSRLLMKACSNLNKEENVCVRDIYFNCLIEMISLLAEHSLVINDDFTAVLIRDFPSV